MICGEKTTTQHAIDTELLRGFSKMEKVKLIGGGMSETYPRIPDMASTSRLRSSVGGAMVAAVVRRTACNAVSLFCATVS